MDGQEGGTLFPSFFWLFITRTVTCNFSGNDVGVTRRCFSTGRCALLLFVDPTDFACSDDFLRLLCPILNPIGSFKSVIK